MSHRFVANGYHNAVAGCYDEARREVLAEYAPRWKTAGRLRRVILWFQMRNEIRRRFRRMLHKAPPDARY
jgi:hypothetical protein